MPLEPDALRVDEHDRKEMAATKSSQESILFIIAGIL
jgi:hypothetical protein